MSTYPLAPRMASALRRSEARRFAADALIAFAFVLGICLALTAFIAVFGSVDAGATQGTITPDGRMLILPP